MNQPEIIKGLYKKPFHYDRDSQTVFDADGNMCVDVRGWGRIQYMNSAEEKQDKFGQFVCDLLNEYFDKAKCKCGQNQNDYLATVEIPMCSRCGNKI